MRTYQGATAARGRSMWLAVVGVLIVGSAVVLPAAGRSAAAPAPPAPGAEQSVSVRPLPLQREASSSMDDLRYHPPRRVVPPSEGAAEIVVDTARTGAARAVAAPGATGSGTPGGLPVRVSAPADTPGADDQPRTAAELRRALGGVAPPSRVRVDVVSQLAAQRVGVRGVVFALSRADDRGETGSVALDVGYTAFADMYGGNFGQRLTLVRLPACAITTPQLPECQVQTPVQGAVNVESAGVVSVPAVPVSAAATATSSPASDVTVYALSSTSMSSAGNYSATSLSPAYDWSAGGHTGGFDWSYPMPVPASPGGLDPGVTLTYSSQSVDGLAANTNNQASWVGRGWEWNSGYVERIFKACSDDGWPSGDLCWSDSDRIVRMVLGGRSMTLVRSQWDNTWRAEHDDGWKAEFVFGGWFAAIHTPKYWWKVTATDGTQYFFGRHQRYEPADAIDTSSTQFVPVFGDDAGEECYATWSGLYRDSWCNQGYRWNLDYVVDPAGNSMTYYYSKYQGRYGRNNNQAAATFDLTATLTRIDYGTRAGQEHTGPAPLRVNLSWFNRVSGGVTWHDVPWDRYCAVSATSCAHLLSPAFFTPFKLDAVTTAVYDPGAAAYRNVDRWDMAYEYPDAGGGSGPTLYLRTITHTGYAADGVTTMVEPPVRFEAIPLQNRFDSTPSNGVPALYHWRMWQIKTGTGREITVDYWGPHCAYGIDPDNNSYRCYPQITTVGSSTGWGWFHKYLVRRVTDTDLIGGSPPEVFDYDYTTEGSTTPVLWAHDNQDMTPIARRTWSNWVGYSTVLVYHGTGSDQQITKRRYFRGLHADRTDAGDYTRTASVSSSQASYTDEWPLAGRLIEETAYTAANVIARSTIHTYSQHLVGVYDAPWPDGDRGMVITRADVTRSRTLLADGTWRWTKTDTDTDGHGLPTQVKHHGEEASTADDSCTVLSYARNTATHLLDTASESITRAGTACTSGTLLRQAQTFYDGTTTLGAAPTAGRPTRSRTHVSAGPDPDQWAETQTSHDSYGRVLTHTDARNQTTTTAYTPTTGGPATQVSITNPLNHVATTSLNRRGQTTRTVDPNGKTTTLAYDPLGRLTDVWTPGRPTSGTPDVNYAYTVSNTANSITTKAIGPNGNQITSHQLFDGRFRPRQTQQPAPVSAGGRIITDTIYNGRDEVAKRSSLYNSSAPAATLVTFNDVDIKTQNRYTYDLLGRTTTDQFWSQNTLKWQTSTVYTGEQTKVTPPTGGTATTTIADANGKTTALRQHLNGATTGPYQTTSYTYDSLGRLTQTTDPAGNRWTTTYDLGDRAKTTTDPDKGTTQMSYNAAGDLLSTIDARGVTLSLAYDVLGRKTELWHGAVGTGAKRASWHYDTLAGGGSAKGHLVRSTRWHNGEAYSSEVTAVDDAYRPLSTKVSLPASMGTLTGPWTTSTVYKPDGAIATRTLPAAGSLPAETITYGYDNAGYSLTMTGLDAYISNTAYTGRGQVNKLWLGNGTKRVQLEKVIDTATGRLTENRVSTENQTTPNTWVPQLVEQYGYDHAGNVKHIAEVTATGTTVSNQCFGYDALRRLTEAWTTTAAACQATPTQANVGGPDPYWTSYTYNSIGNRTTDAVHGPSGDTTRTYTYPASGASSTRPHAASSVTASGLTSGTDSYSYDQTGNTTTRNLAGQPAQTLTWDPEGHLASVADSAGTTSYVYTADGQRLLSFEPGSVTTLYLDGFELRRTSTGIICTRHYGVAARTTNGGLTWTAADHHGTGQAAINPTTLAFTRRKTDPFGNARGPAVAWPTTRGFVDGIQDRTGLTHLGAREYEPRTGRFISVDPLMDLTEPTQWNGYSYANSNPVSASDPDGLVPCYGRDEGDLCPTNKAGPSAPTPAGDMARVKQYPKNHCSLNDARGCKYLPQWTRHEPCTLYNTKNCRQSPTKGGTSKSVTANEIGNAANLPGYVFNWDLGTTSEVGDPTQVMSQFQNEPGAVFPFGLGECTKMIAQQECALQPAPFADKAWVTVSNVTSTSFTFITGIQHFDPPGSAITFEVYQKGDRVYLRQTARWNVHTRGERMKARATQQIAFLMWHAQAGNLRQQARAYQFTRTLDPALMLAYINYSNKYAMS